MFPADLHYQLPQVVLFMPVICVLLFLYVIYYRFKKLREAYFVQNLVLPNARVLFWFKSFLLSFSWIFVTIALMQPVGNGHYLEGKVRTSLKVNSGVLKRKAHDVVILIDASSSMLVKDSRMGTERLMQAKDIADQIIASFEGESAALYAFTSEVDQYSPMTLDGFFLRMMLQQMVINPSGVPGTDLFAAVAAIRKQYFARSSPKLKSLILISDGGDTTLEALTGNERDVAISNLGQLVGDAEKLQLRVYTIGVGSINGQAIPGVSLNGAAVLSKLEPAPLQRLAEVGRGMYYNSSRLAAIDSAKEIRQQMLKDPPYYDEQDKLLPGSILEALLGSSPIVYDRYFQYPLALAVVLFLIAFMLPDSFHMNIRGSR